MEAKFFDTSAASVGKFNLRSVCISGVNFLTLDICDLTCS